MAQALGERLKSSVDVVFPVVHGQFGEGGQLQRVLEEAGVHYVGTPAAASEIAFHKFRWVGETASLSLCLWARPGERWLGICIMIVGSEGLAVRG